VYAGEHRIVFARHRDQPHCCTVRMFEMGKGSGRKYG
jgi:hypothetical protein